MASVNWQKHSGGTSVKAQFRHCDLDERLKTNHSNMQIDSSLTNRNLSFGCFTRGYKSACAEYDNRVKDIDDHANLTRKPRKDRVTCVSWSIPCPANMSDDMASRWFSDVYGLLTREYSDVLGASVHFDEVHEYVDAFTGEKTKSRAHMHAFVLPVVEKDGFRRLIGKDFSKRENMIKLNNSIQKLTEDKYPGYTFMTGAKHKGSYQTVEDLKAQSKRKAFEDEIEHVKSNALQVIDSERAKFKAEVDAHNSKLAERERAVAERESNAKAKEDQLDAYEIKVKDIEGLMDVSVSKYMHTKKFLRGEQSILLIDMFKEWVRKQEKAANDKKQKAKPQLSSPKPVDYTRKALGVVGEQVVEKAAQDARESIKRKPLILPWEHEDDKGDEWSL